MINPFVTTAVLVMLPVVGDPGCPLAPAPAAGIVTTLSDSAEPAADPVGDLLREIGKKKLREEMERAANEAKMFGRTPEEIYLFRSQNPDAIAKQPSPTENQNQPGPDGGPRRKAR